MTINELHSDRILRRNVELLAFVCQENDVMKHFIY